MPAETDPPDHVESEPGKRAGGATTSEADGLEVSATAEPLAERRRRRAEEARASSRKGLMIVIPLVMVGAGVVAFVLEGMKDQAIYSKPVDELVASKARFAGRQVMAEGNLVHGTITKRDQPCEYRFTIEKNATQVPVRFPQCVVPDTFRDVAGMDVGVTVEGELLADNTFLATKVLAKCPSKYEMKDKAARGEKMPHLAVESQGL